MSEILIRNITKEIHNQLRDNNMASISKAKGVLFTVFKGTPYVIKVKQVATASLKKWVENGTILLEVDSEESVKNAFRKIKGI